MAGGHTRLPLCEPGHGLEDAVGFIHTKDLLPITFGQTEPDVRSLARPFARVTESTRLDEVLREMRRDRRHLTLVLDEHGTVVGLVILEEIVGEIEDEFDPSARELIRSDDGSLRIDGAAPLRLVAEQLGMDIDAPHEPTIAGHVAERLGRLPEPDEVIVVAQLLGNAAGDEERLLGGLPREGELLRDHAHDEVVAEHAVRERLRPPLVRTFSVDARPARSHGEREGSG